MLKLFLTALKMDGESPALRRAQISAFSSQIPLLYFILCVNSLTVAYAFVGIAPFTLTVIAPSVLVGVCLFRMGFWIRSRKRALSDMEVARRLKATVVLGAVIGISFLFWALALFQYGGMREQDQVVFFIGVTVISCIFCLMHLRPAALLITGIIVIPFTGFLISTGNPTLVSIGINLVLVSAAMVYVLLVSSRDFAKLVSSQVETRRLSDENARLAHIDHLTGLPNRRQFFAELNGAVDQCAGTGSPLVVGIVDLDGFKPVNDRFGHLTGDQVLVTAAERLRTISDGAVFISRLGGDEFGIILRRPLGESDLSAFGEQVALALQAPYEVTGVVANISASIGFAAFPAAGDTAAKLYEHADYALYHAKNNQRGRPVVFSIKHEIEMNEKTLTERCLRSADLDREMSLHFQPLYDVTTNRPIAFEALARWNSPQLGSVSPGVFIPLAERIGMVSEITQCLLPKALRAASHWPEDFRISFNLSARDIDSPGALLRIISILENSPIDPARIDLEVTETYVVADFDQARRSLLVLKALGVDIALDDFGVGYSSLSHIHRLPLDKIKVDRSFMHGIGSQEASHNLIKSVIALCDNLGIACVIEGAETADQAQILKELGCKTIQGYFFGRPVPQDEVPDLIRHLCSAALPELPAATDERRSVRLPA